MSQFSQQEVFKVADELSKIVSDGWVWNPYFIGKWHLTELAKEREKYARIAEAADPCTCKKVTRCHARIADAIRRTST